LLRGALAIQQRTSQRAVFSTLSRRMRATAVFGSLAPKSTVKAFSEAAKIAKSQQRLRDAV